MRYIARALALIWAGFWTLCVVLSFLFHLNTYPCIGCFPKPPREVALRAVLSESWWILVCLLLMGWGGAALLVYVLPKMARRLSKRRGRNTLG